MTTNNRRRFFSIFFTTLVLLLYGSCQNIIAGGDITLNVDVSQSINASPRSYAASWGTQIPWNVGLILGNYDIENLETRAVWELNVTSVDLLNSLDNLRYQIENPEDTLDPVNYDKELFVSLDNILDVIMAKNVDVCVHLYPPYCLRMPYEGENANLEIFMVDPNYYSYLQEYMYQIVKRLTTDRESKGKKPVTIFEYGTEYSTYATEEIGPNHVTALDVSREYEEVVKAIYRLEDGFYGRKRWIKIGGIRGIGWLDEFITYCGEHEPLRPEDGETSGLRCHFFSFDGYIGEKEVAFLREGNPSLDPDFKGKDYYAWFGPVKSEDVAIWNQESCLSYTDTMHMSAAHQLVWYISAINEGLDRINIYKAFSVVSDLFAKDSTLFTGKYKLPAFNAFKMVDMMINRNQIRTRIAVNESGEETGLNEIVSLAAKKSDEKKIGVIITNPSLVTHRICLNFQGMPLDFTSQDYLYQRYLIDENHSSIHQGLGHEDLELVEDVIRPAGTNNYSFDMEPFSSSLIIMSALDSVTNVVAGKVKRGGIPVEGALINFTPLKEIPNLLSTNTSAFDQGLGGWYPSAGTVWSATEGMDGTGCLKAAGEVWAAYTCGEAVGENLGSSRMKIKVAARGTSGAMLQILYYGLDKDGNGLGYGEAMPYTHLTEAWGQYESEFVIPVSNVDKILLIIYNRKPTAAIWVDDIKLTQIDDNLLSPNSSTFDQGLWEWYPSAGTVWSATEGMDGTGCLKAAGEVWAAYTCGEAVGENLGSSRMKIKVAARGTSGATLQILYYGLDKDGNGLGYGEALPYTHLSDAWGEYESEFVIPVSNVDKILLIIYNQEPTAAIWVDDIFLRNLDKPAIRYCDRTLPSVTVISQSDGRYEIHGLEPGECCLSISRKGGELAEKFITVTKGTNEIPDIGLEVDSSIPSFIEVVPLMDIRRPIIPGSTRQFIAFGKDRTGKPVTFTPVWSVENDPATPEPPAGAIDQNGLFTASASYAGNAYITVSGSGIVKPYPVCIKNINKNKVSNADIWLEAEDAVSWNVRKNSAGSYKTMSNYSPVYGGNFCLQDWKPLDFSDYEREFVLQDSNIDSIALKIYNASQIGTLWIDDVIAENMEPSNLLSADTSTFDQGLGGWYPSAGTVWSATEGIDGTGCLKAAGEVWAAYTGYEAVGENLGRSRMKIKVAARGTSGAMLQILYYGLDKDGNGLGYGEAMPYTHLSDAWGEYESEFVIPVSNVDKILLIIYNREPTATIWVDDIKLTQIDDNLLSPDTSTFDQGLGGWYPSAGTVWSATEGMDGTGCLKAAGEVWAAYTGYEAVGENLGRSRMKIKVAARGTSRAMLQILYYGLDKDGNGLGYGEAMPYTHLSDAWGEYESEFVIPVSNVDKILLIIYNREPTATIWVDDIKLTQIEKHNFLSNGTFNSSAAGWSLFGDTTWKQYEGYNNSGGIKTSAGFALVSEVVAGNIGRTTIRCKIMARGDSGVSLKVSYSKYDAAGNSLGTTTIINTPVGQTYNEYVADSIIDDSRTAKMKLFITKSGTGYLWVDEIRLINQSENLLENGNFDNTANPWQLYDGSIWTNNEGKNGTGGIKSSSSYEALQSERFGSNLGTSKMKVRVTAKGEGGPYLKLTYLGYDRDGNLLGEWDTGIEGLTVNRKPFPVDSPGYYYLLYKLYASTSGTYNIRFAGHSLSNSCCSPLSWAMDNDNFSLVDGTGFDTNYDPSYTGDYLVPKAGWTPLGSINLEQGWHWFKIKGEKPHDGSEPYMFLDAFSFDDQ